MSIGSINIEHRKQFQKIAGGAKWRSKVITVEDAQAIIAKALRIGPNEYAHSKINELSSFISYKTSCTGDLTMNLKDYRAKYYVRR